MKRFINIIIIMCVFSVGIFVGLFWNNKHTEINITKEEVKTENKSQNNQLKEINLYYYNSEKDKDASGNIKCSRDGLVAVKRKVELLENPIESAIKLLIAGNLTSWDKQRGISTEFPLEGFSLRSSSLKNGVLTLIFNDPNNKTSGGSCRAGILWFQIEATAKQFTGVEQVRFLPEDLFQP